MGFSIDSATLDEVVDKINYFKKNYNINNSISEKEIFVSEVNDFISSIDKEFKKFNEYYSIFMFNYIEKKLSDIKYPPLHFKKEDIYLELIDSLLDQDIRNKNEKKTLEFIYLMMSQSYFIKKTN